MTTERPAMGPSPRVSGLRTAVVAMLALAGGAALAAGLFGGRPQVVGALFGAALVTVFFLFGTVSTSMTAAYAPAVSLLVALLTYTLQVVLLAVVFVAVQRSGVTEADLDVRWLAGVVIVGTLVWTTVLIRAAVRIRIPIYDLPASGADVAEASEITRPEGARG